MKKQRKYFGNESASSPGSSTAGAGKSSNQPRPEKHLEERRPRSGRTEVIPFWEIKSERTEAPSKGAKPGKPGGFKSASAERGTPSSTKSAGTRPATDAKPGTTVKSAPHGKGRPESAQRKPVPAKGSDAGHTRQERQVPSLRSGQTVELSITSTNDDGFGQAMHQGTRVLVAGGLPGEQLVARVTYVGRRETFATILKCLKSSPDRNPSPACQMGRVCDGCALMQMRYKAQLAWKKNLVAKELRKYPSLSEAVLHDTIASPKELGYRNSAKLVVAGKHSDPVIGIYRRNSHDVLEIADCPLHHPLINKVVKAAKVGIKKGKVPVYNAKSEMGLLRYLVVRVAEPGDRVMVVLVTSEQGYNEMHHLAKHIQQAVPEVAVVAQNINNSTGNVIFGNKDRFITKAQTLRASIGDKSFTLSPRSFFQVNTGAAGIIYEKVRELAGLTGTERVIDLYCGIGGISFFLARQAKEVVGIEVVDTAVLDATENAAHNGIKNCTFEAGDAAHLLDEIGEEGGAQLIVLNPPRKGCDEKVLKSAAALQPAKIIYVSCSPETLTRDLDILSRLGYRTVEVHPVDMFPQTVHVEDVALLVRQED